MATELIGRERELAELLRRFDLAVRGMPQLVLCSGEAGIGKTRLVAELAERVQARGACSLWARALELPDAPPFWLWRQAFGTVELGTEDQSAGRALLFDGFVERLSGGEEPVLLVIDDIHWTDEPSLLALLHVVRRLREHRVLVCATERDTVADVVPAWRVVKPDLLREPVTQVLALSGLSRQDSASCLRGEAGRALPDHVAAEAYTMTAGNPFYLRELGRSLRAAETLRLPATLREVVRGRLAPLTASGQELLRAASILGDEFAIAVAARLVGRSAMACLGAVDEAVSAGLLVTGPAAGTVRFCHSLVRAALQEGLSLQQRVLLHSKAAQALEALYPEARDQHAAALARHYSEAAVAGDRTPAVHWARRAGDTALRELAFEEAIRLYGLALDNAEELPAAERGRLLLARATAYLRAGDLAAARADCAAAITLGHHAGVTALVVEGALVLEPIGDRVWDRDIHEWCVGALAENGVSDALRARLLARATEAAVYLGQLGQVGETSREALELADVSADPAALVAALRARQLACSGPQDAAERADLAVRMIDTGVRARDPTTEMWGRLWAVDSLWDRGRIAAITAELSRLRWCVRHTGGPMASWHLLIVEAAVAQGRGDLDDAVRLGEQARELAESIGHPAGEGAFRALLAVVGHHRGHDAFSCELPPASTRGEVRNELFGVLGTAFPLVESGRQSEAAPLYRGLGPPREWDIPPYFLLNALVVGGVVATGLRLTDDVRYFAGRLAEYRGRHIVGGGGNAHYLGPAELWLGKYAMALGDSLAAERDLTAARTICQDIGARCYVVEADCELAAVLLERGDTEAALGLANTALPLAESYGMRPWVVRLRAIVTTASAKAVLSPREREVAELVADGLTNREIARVLVLSERTAQNHVQHVLTKLGFTNRSQITAWVNRIR